MLRTLLRRITRIVLTILVFFYILLEEVVWERLAKPIYVFIHGLAVLQRVERWIYRIDRHALLLVFLFLFINVELLGLLAVALVAKGKVIAGTAVYAGKIPVAAFTFWIFRISKDKLMAFEWFRKSHDMLILAIDRIKASAIHRGIVAKAREIKVWLKMRLAA